jgi:hypothetical protein
MSDRTTRADTFDQQPSPEDSQSGITVGHEDLRAWLFLDSSTTPEVFAMFKTHDCQQRS